MSETPVDVPNGEDPPQKTAKQLEKEKLKLAKIQKFKLKQEKRKAEFMSKSKKKVENSDKKKDDKDVIKYTIDTPAGEKKDVTCPMPEAYSPQFVEAAWYSWWEKQGFFKPEYGGRDILEENPKGKFVMIIPPPNVTGFLHLGHALTNAVEDTITRWNRMKGRTTLWNPGCDHAGIATQVVVEKKLWKEEKKTRYDIGREKFIEKVWEWKNEKSNRIYKQLKKLGGSFDWDRACFTMDKKCCKAVTEAFVRLHEDGVIYRSNRLVNWSCALKSAISDIEVDKKELTCRTKLMIPGYDEPVEFGAMIYFIYVTENTDIKIVVATTRIETMLGDTAIAVNPKDHRYSDLIGQKVIHPFCDRKLEIIGDSYVDMEFGTGAVKITPAHDPNDYEIGKRHNLPFITIFSEDGRIIGNYGQFTGLKRFEARKKIIFELIERNLLVEVKDNPMVIPICSRSKDVVEPLIKPQWYVRCDDMAAKAKEAVESGELKIIPEQFKKTWFSWMDGMRDWCISRQLWWGHRIPAYFVKLHDFEPSDDEKNNYWVAGRTEEEARKKAAEKFNIGEDKFSLQQDSDVLDTWFSSGIFPFSIFGWPDKTKELEAFYPGTLLETGHDILFFWVARMVFLGQKLMNKLPFKEVYLHAMVRDAHGRKMSKSLGNVVDPMDVINGISLNELQHKLLDTNLEEKELIRAMEGQKLDYPNGIPECGTDALRFALCAYTRQGRDINLDIFRVQGYRTFCNKIWNATRFALNYVNEEFQFDENDVKLTGNESRMDLWMLSRLTYAIKTCDEGMSQYDFTSVTTACYNLWLYELCDFYLEYMKPIMQSGTDLQKEICKKVLFRALDIGLKLLSPLMPFITEELYQRLPRKEIKFPSICVAAYPKTEEYPWRNETIEQDFELAQKVIKNIRSVRAAYTISKRTKTEVFYVCQDDQMNRIISDFSDVIKTLTCSDILKSDNPPNGCVIVTLTDKLQLHILLKGIIDPEKEMHKLNCKKDFLKELIHRVNQTMSAADYETKVPEEVKITNTEKLSNAKAEIIHIEEALETLRLM